MTATQLNTTADRLLKQTQRLHCANEHRCSLWLQASLRRSQPQQIQTQASQLTQQLIATAQEQQPTALFDAFFQEYNLSNHEGIALMSLAEALMRIPDQATALALINDKLTSANWQQHLGHSASTTINAASLALVLGQAHCAAADTNSAREQEHKAPTPAFSLGQLIDRLTDAGVYQLAKKLTQIMGQHFILAETSSDGMAVSQAQRTQRQRYSFDMLGEAAQSSAQARQYFQRYQQALEDLAQQTHNKDSPPWLRDSLSIKLSALHPRFEFSQWQRVHDELYPKLEAFLLQAVTLGICVSIDAEESDRLELQVSLFERLLSNPTIAQSGCLGFVLQAYQKRARKLVHWLLTQVQSHSAKISVRLVKGAYWDQEIKQAQQLRLPDYPVFTLKSNTELSYLYCAQQLLQSDGIHPQFATHNPNTLSRLSLMIPAEKVCEFQHLHGMGETLLAAFIAHQPNAWLLRTYAPIGTHQALLPYLVRRLLENGSSQSCLQQMHSQANQTHALFIAPETNLERMSQDNCFSGYRHSAIRKPNQLYTGRTTHGMLLESLANQARLTEALSGPQTSIRQAAQQRQADISETQTLQSLRAFQPSWAQNTKRAEILNQCAQQLESNRNTLMALLIEEAGKTQADALNEIYEAVDLLRYYAQQQTQQQKNTQQPGPSGELNELQLIPRGIVVCISPWNFPLAIFCGQIAAALVTGNCVLAKPASITSRIAHYTRSLFVQAGLPADCFALLLKNSAQLAEDFWQQADIDAIVFTGSNPTAQQLRQQLFLRTGKSLPLLCETGGINAMIIDSSAHFEQSITDVIASAFHSAGQRCSSLRMLFVQADIADEFIQRLQDALNEQRLGHGESLASDIGPLASKEACQRLHQYLESIAQQNGCALIRDGRVLLKTLDSERFLGPCLIEFERLAMPKREAFGPILHIARFDAQQLSAVVDTINACGYGLTCGIQTRIDARAQWLSQQLRVGNVYINRNTVGAVVESQPFGGVGLSGSGFKAGGPHYLLQFVEEKTISCNTAATGGDAQLINLGDE